MAGTSRSAGKGGAGGTGRLIGNAIKYGPVAYELLKKYGPTVQEQVVSNKDAILHTVRPGAKGNPRRSALAHAASVIDGSAMETYYQAQEYWVVFSGDTPIGVHPHTAIPYAELLRHSDLSKRVRPDAAPRGLAGRLGQVAKAVAQPKPAPRRSAPRSGGTVPPRAEAPRQTWHEEPVEGEII